jgi:putative ABC transport system substrate-binding protein
LGVEDWANKRFAEEGFVPGRDLRVEYVDLRLEDPDMSALEGRARAMLASRPDVVIVGEDGIELLQRLTRTVPLVFYQFSADPVAFGLVESYGRPGGNITGTTYAAPGGEMKGWELLKELSPTARRIGTLWREWELGERWVPMVRSHEKAAARRLGLERVEIVFPRATTFAPIERVIRAAHVDVLDAGNDNEEPWFPELMKYVARTKLPALYGHVGRVRQGGLVSANASTGQAMVEAFAIAGKILRGAKPGEIPVSVPTRYVLAINLRTARAMGLAVPSSVLLRATTVIDQ